MSVFRLFYLSFLLLTVVPAIVAGSDVTKRALTGNIVSGCVPNGEYNSTVGQTDYFPDKVGQYHDNQFSVTYYNNYKIVNVTSARFEFSVSFVLVQCGTPSPNITGLETIYVPIQNGLGSDSTTDATFLELLGLRSQIKVLNAPGDFVSPCIQNLTASGQIQSLNTTNSTPQINPLSVYFADAFNWDLHYYSTGPPPPYVPIDNEDDTTPLNRTAWMEYFAIFGNLEATATELLQNIAARYSCHANNANLYSTKPVIAFASVYTSPTYSSYTISSAGYIQKFITDAGATPATSGTFSNLSDLQQLLQNVDIVIDGSYNQPENLDAFFINYGYVAASNTKFIQSGNVFTIDRLQNSQGDYAWFESAYAQADVVLRDFIYAAHPGYPFVNDTVYLRKLANPAQSIVVTSPSQCTDPSAALQLLPDNCVPLPTSTPTSTSTPTPTSTPTSTSTSTPTLTSTSTSTSISISTSTPTPTSTSTTPASTTSTTPTNNPKPTPTSSSTGSTNTTPTPSSSAVVAFSSSNAGAIAGGIIGGLVGLALLVLLLWLFRLRYWNKKEIKEKENKSLDNSSYSQPILENSGYSQPMLAMSDMKSERAVSSMSIDSRIQSSGSSATYNVNMTDSVDETELMSNRVEVDERARSATGSSSILSKTDDILIPFSSLKLGAVLGQGNFGQVFQATYRGGPAAVKKLKGVEKEQIIEEAKMMKSVPNHANVLQYFGVSEHEGEIMMVTELCDKGNLAQYLRHPNNNLTLIQCRQLCCQVASGMWHISTYGIVHRDLRTENILLQLRGNEPIAKVADFGMARSLQSRDDTRDSGYYRMIEVKEIPIAWTAPEVLTNQLKYVAASDVWSFGIVMWEIYSRGAKPFDEMSVQLMAASIRDPKRTTPLLSRPDKCPDDIFAIMNLCWAFNPQDRPSFEQLYNQLS